MKICLYAHICWGCQDWHFKNLLRDHTKGPARSRRRELTWIYTRLSIFSFVFRASRNLSVHWLNFFCHSHKPNILTTFTAAARLSCHSPSGKRVNTNMNICENKIWHCHHRRLWRTAEMSVRMQYNWLISRRWTLNAAQMWFQNRVTRCDCLSGTVFLRLSDSGHTGYFSFK